VTVIPSPSLSSLRLRASTTPNRLNTSASASRLTAIITPAPSPAASTPMPALALSHPLQHQHWYPPVSMRASAPAVYTFTSCLNIASPRSTPSLTVFWLSRHQHYSNLSQCQPSAQSPAVSTPASTVSTPAPAIALALVTLIIRLHASYLFATLAS